MILITTGVEVANSAASAMINEFAKHIVIIPTNMTFGKYVNSTRINTAKLHVTLKRLKK